MERRGLGGQESQISGKDGSPGSSELHQVEVRHSSCQLSPLIGLILSQRTPDIFTDSRVLGAEFRG